MSTVETIQAISSSDLLKTDISTQLQLSNQTTSFISYLENVNNQLQVADTNLQNAALGKPMEMHEVLIQMEQTKVSFELLIETRNKLMEAYQELLRMQI